LALTRSRIMGRASRDGQNGYRRCVVDAGQVRFIRWISH